MYWKIVKEKKVIFIKENEKETLSLLIVVTGETKIKSVERRFLFPELMQSIEKSEFEDAVHEAVKSLEKIIF